MNNKELQNPENAIRDFVDMITKSWTWKKMTYEELTKCLQLFLWGNLRAAIKGSYKQRFEICHAIYSAYLAGIGYDGPNWRNQDT